MTQKVLVADDSLTIQKVVAITLADDPVEIVECLEESLLEESFDSDQFDLILLDYNLSEELSGIELAKKIRSFEKNTPIILLLGTFDQVGDDVLSEAGIQDKIVKPFESHSFIEKCRSLLKRDNTESLDLEQKSETGKDSYPNTEEVSVDDDEFDQWKLDESKNDDSVLETHSAVEMDDLSEISNPVDLVAATNELHSELSGWGVAVPNIIGNVSEGSPLPPIISDEKDENTSNGRVISQLVPLTELTPEKLEETEEEVQSINESELEQEIALEINPDDFWAADEDLSEGSESSPLLGGSSVEPDVLEKVDNSITASALLEETPIESGLSLSISKDDPLGIKDVSPTSAQREDVLIAETSIDLESTVELLFEKLKPLLDAKIKEYCSARVDEVSWEVIPDLAENLIRKEIQSISKSISDS